MSTKSVPGDGAYAKGAKGSLFVEPRRGFVAVARNIARSVMVLRQR
ncbi:hypothetical protein AB0469_40985 [Streptomyces sp. NPDC093801]